MSTWTGACLLPYIVNGDVGQCWLPRGHRETCLRANEVHLELARRAAAQAEAEFNKWLADES